MLIGQLADRVDIPTRTIRFYERKGLLPEPQRVDIPTRTIRFYERKGLLPEPQRADNGYRVYDNATLARLRFIRSAQAAGLTLAEIASIIHVRDDGTAPCSHVDSLLETKLAEVRERRRQLVALETELTQLLDRSRQLDPADCTAGEICHIFSPTAHT